MLEGLEGGGLLSLQRQRVLRDLPSTPGRCQRLRACQDVCSLYRKRQCVRLVKRCNISYR